ncbi:hypothetical protein OG422_00335 [Streptomyces sp. NBC_01525]|uniref:hypothetical protein n=1 Tax=Streptomyces sp. NBC_01525 TaxID=2903893 RepID=UPI003868A78F
MLAATVSERPSGQDPSAHAFGDDAGRLPGVIDDVVELKVQVPEVVAGHAPMSLFSLEVQFDEIHHDLLPRSGQLRRGREGGGIGLRTARTPGKTPMLVSL